MVASSVKNGKSVYERKIGNDDSPFTTKPWPNNGDHAWKFGIYFDKDEDLKTEDWSVIFSVAKYKQT